MCFLQHHFIRGLKVRANDTLNQFGQPDHPRITEAWDMFQRFGCCGVDNYTDWKESVNVNFSKRNG